MYKKMSGRRRAAFLASLEASGNQTLAAEKACVSRSWVCKERALNPGFDAACRAAIGGADVRLRGGEGNRPAAKGWGHLDGVELVVRGSNRRRVQVARARAGQWTARSEDRFLQVLAATCNVKAAYGAAGKSKGSAYSHRKRWPAFDQRWKAAEKMGSMRLRLALVEHAANPFSTIGQPPLEPVPPLRIDEMLQCLWLHKHATDGLGGRPGRAVRPMDFSEACRRISDCVEAVEDGAALDEAVKTRDREEFARRRSPHAAGDGEAGRPRLGGYQNGGTSAASFAGSRSLPSVE
jgi:hypothetical protein